MRWRWIENVQQRRVAQPFVFFAKAGFNGRNSNELENHKSDLSRIRDFVW
jgi:hypothetical protein